MNRLQSSSSDESVSVLGNRNVNAVSKHGGFFAKAYERISVSSES